MPQTPFDEIYARAVARKGEEALRQRLPRVKSTRALEDTPDSRWLAGMTRCVFSAGFRWRVIDAKWDGFEEAFLGFNPSLVAAFDDSTINRLRQDTRIVRNPQKIVATVRNAAYVRATSEAHDGFGRWVASWPADDVVGLWAALADGGARLGGATGPRFLRLMGVDTFILTPDVVHALTEQGVMTGKPTSKKQRHLAQDAFLRWKQEGGRSLGELSVILACSVDRPGGY